MWMKKAGLNRKKRMNNYSSESPLPNSSQELLLKVALSDKETALDCWTQWKSINDFENDVDLGSFRLLPLVFHKLQTFDYSDELTGRLKGIYRKSWSNNQQLIYKASLLIDEIRRVGIEVMAVKGIPLSLTVYNNLAIRPMYDVDILVPLSTKMEAIQFLRDKGFVPDDERILEFSLIYGKGMGFKNESGFEVDLHWRPLLDSIMNSDPDDFWDKARPIKIGNTRALIMSPEDELLCTFVHGLRRKPLPPIRWVADAVSIIRNNKDNLDWDRFLAYSVKYKVVIQVKSGLGYIYQTFDLPVPEDVIRKLKRISPSYSEKVIYKQAQWFGDHRQKFTFPERVFTFYARYLRYSTNENIVKIHLKFAMYSISRIKSRIYNDNKSHKTKEVGKLQ